MVVRFISVGFVSVRNGLHLVSLPFDVSSHSYALCTHTQIVHKFIQFSLILREIICETRAGKGETIVYDFPENFT